MSDYVCSYIIALYVQLERGGGGKFMDTLSKGSPEKPLKWNVSV